MIDDCLAVDLDAFIAEHRRCGDLATGMIETAPPCVWLTCSCGARIEQLVVS
jgi:hypothetical protein